MRWRPPAPRPLLASAPLRHDAPRPRQREAPDTAPRWPSTRTLGSRSASARRRSLTPLPCVMTRLAGAIAALRRAPLAARMVLEEHEDASRCTTDTQLSGVGTAH